MKYEARQHGYEVLGVFNPETVLPKLDKGRRTEPLLVMIAVFGKSK